MSNWTHISADDLKAAGRGEIMDKARTTAIGTTDPVIEAIAEAVARVRRAISTGNALDVDTAKVPNSLKAVAVRVAIFVLMERIRYPLSEDQKDTRRNDNSDLNRIHDSKQRVEIPDTPAPGGGEMQSQPSPYVVPANRKFTERTMDGI